MKNEQQTCAHCKFWIEETGECRGLPPQMVGIVYKNSDGFTFKEGLRAVYPMTDPDCECALFNARKT